MILTLIDFVKKIIEFLLQLDCSTTFHFEVGADLFDKELLSLFEHYAPPAEILCRCQ